MTPVGDFVCNSAKCRTEDGAPMYENLPIKTTRCPVCGSKRIQRIFNSAPMVASGMVARNEQMAQVIRPALDKAERPKLDAAPQNADDWAKRQLRERFAVRPDKFGEVLAGYGMHPGLSQGWGQKINVISKTPVRPFEAGRITDPVIEKAKPGPPDIIATDGVK